MSGSEDESVNSGSNATDTEEVLLFECKKCGQHCTAAEKDSHRAMHIGNKRKRAPSPGESEVPTLFHPVVPETPRSGRLTRRTGAQEIASAKAEKRTESGKRRSIKKYDKTVKAIKCKGV